MENEIKSMMLSLGADVCGIAGLERFENAPVGFHPTDLYAVCKSAIVFGVALTKGLTQVDSRLIYGHYNNNLCSVVDNIAFLGAKRLEEAFSMTAVPIPCDSPYEYWDKEAMTGKGLLSMKHAAVAAGLGQLGKSTLLLNPKYGNLLTIGVILTDRELQSDLTSRNICIESCRKCLDACPVEAIAEGSVIQKSCRQHTYNTNARGFETVDCNLCRLVCPVKYGEERMQ